MSTHRFRCAGAALALAGATTLGVVGVGAVAVHAASSPTAPVAAPTRTAPPKLPYVGTKIYSGINCAGPGAGYNRILQQRGKLAYCSRDGYTFTLPALANPPGENRRSEVFWGTAINRNPKNNLRYREGDTMVFDGRMIAELGPAADDDNDFHYVWQSHGPKTNGQAFAGPLMRLDVKNGHFNIGGGRGNPINPAKAMWYQNIGEFRNGQYYDFRVEVKLSSNPKVGWVSAWLNGTQVLDHFRPRMGTLYPGTAYVQSRGGIYRGSKNTIAPNYEQKVSWKINEIR